ncbi:Diphthamide biosynthesis protein 2 [Coemansia brasiliensis]|uniref:2-(3-amino-3-carboxypropyl)histidine synthase subunit 2 n=1 Tax=Coemansia brasiliensis TaxID=2650707 RepID=A0A9W8I8V5_9FUNG|nr:Diphthamide biosynthesis protein 2 [Coemansia brasiliensis]
MQAPAAIDSDGREVIERDAIASERQVRTAEEAVEVYEIERTARAITDGGYCMIALQFPDELLADSTLVAEQLQARVNAQIFVLADTSYGSCCVDEVAAQHYHADLVVHYGRTCLSLTSQLPVLYVFGHEHVDIDDVAKQAERELEGKRVVVVGDVPYTHVLDKVAQRIQSGRLAEVVVARIPAQDQVYIPTQQTSSNIIPGRSWKELTAPVREYSMLYIGEESPTLTNLLVTMRFQTAYSYQPSTQKLRVESSKVNRHLGQRYHMVQRVKDANIIGIVAGTLAATKYRQVLESLKQLMRRHGRKFYVFVVGKLNVAKLANFPEIEAYVLVACPETSLVDSKEFFQPVVTPYELLLSLSHSREWSGEYMTDFHELLQALDEESLAGDDEIDEDEPHFSLITGTLKKTQRYYNHKQRDEDIASVTGDMTVRCKNTEIAQYMGSAGAEYLLSRSFQGLGHDNENHHDIEPMLAEDGLSGIASKYSHEQSNS